MADSDFQAIMKKVELGSDSALPRQEYAVRVGKLQQLMRDRNMDLLLYTGAENIFYLSGQQTPGYYAFQCLCVPVDGQPFLVIRGLEAMNARANSYLEDIVGYDDGDDPAEVLAAAITERGWKGRAVAIDRNSWFLTVNIHERLTKACGDLADGSGLVETLRRVKSDVELEQLRLASHANDVGMQAGIDATKTGATENDIAAAIMEGSIRAGGEYVGMEPFVTSGPRSGVPHTTWRRRRIEAGDVVILETAACYNRYHVARFQTLFMGSVPQLARDMYNVCEEGLVAALDAIKPGRPCSEPHNACQAVIDRHGFTAGFRKRTGYGMGISFAPDWGEGNLISLYKNVTTELEPGMVFHIPITLRDYGKFTVAASETIVVTNDGYEVLSKLPRKLIER